MLGHDALCLWTMPPVPWRARAATCVTSSWRASRNINAKFPYTLWGARAVTSISDGYVGINRRGDTLIVPTSLKKAWSEASNSHTPSGPPVGVDTFAQQPPQQIFIFVNFREKGVSHLTSCDIMVCKICKWSRKRKWETCHSKKTMRNLPQAIYNPHVECFELSTAWEIRERPIGKLKVSFPESIWSSNMEITNNILP